MYPCAGMDFSSLVFHNCIVYSVWRSLIVLIEKRCPVQTKGTIEVGEQSMECFFELFQNFSSEN